ncbi:histidine kinase [Chryseobacterium gleum]|uniref:histidine kinase n=1 Tax=Chryseobacterium gleum TaxID=250 RepID=UPI00289993FA|nr:histidine kinase [Chryseobacterium gleum]
MKTEIQSYTQIDRELWANYPELTVYERLNIAVQIERNQILENGLAVTSDDSKPAALEAVAIALGYTSSQSSTINDVLKDILRAIENKE